MIRTKLVITVGPACDDTETLGAMIDAGVDVFRLNFSHGTHESHATSLAHIREAAGRRNTIVAVMGDLCGPKIRLDRIEGGQMTVETGDTLVIQREEILGAEGRVSCNYPQLIDEVHPGQRILVDDGSVRFTVTEKRDDEIACRCDVRGTLRDRKGINLPDSELSTPALTEKDHADLAWAIEHDLDYVALSFVRHAEDIGRLRDALDAADSDIRVISKIEKPEAIEHIDAIIDASDVVLVARGDLGVEMDLARVPMLQKDIALRCQRAAKPVIIATQMLQSMVDSPVATRAEVSDVANAILDHADAIMLSAETSVGRFPLEAVHTTQRISRETELFRRRYAEETRPSGIAAEWEMASAVASAASIVASDLDVKLVVAWTGHGNTARLLSKHRLDAKIVALSPDERVCRQMAIYFGVEPFAVRQSEDMGRMLCDLDRMLLDKDLAQTSDRIVVVAGTRLNKPGGTDAMFIHVVGEGDKPVPMTVESDPDSA